MPKKQGQITPKIDLKFRWFSEISDLRFRAVYGCHTPTPSTSNEIGWNFVEMFLLVRGSFPQSLSRFHATFGGYCMPRRKVNFKKWWRCLSRPLLYIISAFHFRLSFPLFIFAYHFRLSFSPIIFAYHFRLSFQMTPTTTCTVNWALGPKKSISCLWVNKCENILCDSNV